MTPGQLPPLSSFGVAGTPTQLPPLSTASAAPPPVDDGLLYLPDTFVDENAMNADEALDIACKRLSLPTLGGPSRRGWSYFNNAMSCPYRWFLRYMGKQPEEVAHPKVLQIGSLYHALQAFTEAPRLGPCVSINHGLMSLGMTARTRGRPPTNTYVVPDGSVDRLLAVLKEMAHAASTGKARGPTMNYILEAERLWEHHVEHWDHGAEDQQPLAVEWLAEHPSMEYSCRYDGIMKAGKNDPQFPEGAVTIRELKTASWMDEERSEGWYLDGEILGQLMLWEPSGAAARFGPLHALVVNVVTKGKVPQCQLITVPANLPAVKRHAKWIAYLNAEIAMWKATDTYPQHWVACQDRFGRCPYWGHCTSITDDDGAVK